MSPGASASRSGVDALGPGSDERTPAGLYVAVLPVHPVGEAGPVACVVLFRTARE